MDTTAQAIRLGKLHTIMFRDGKSDAERARMLEVIRDTTGAGILMYRSEDSGDLQAVSLPPQTFGQLLAVLGID